MTIAAIVIIILLIVTVVAATTVRQLGPGRQPASLPQPRPGLLGRPSVPPTAEDPDFPPPIRFRDYALTELARGGVGTVYHAVHPMNGRVYAVKQLSRQFANDQLVIDAFHRGCAMLMQLRHPNIVKVYYDWTEPNDGRQDHFVVMEYLPGDTLNERIHREAPLPFDESFLTTIRGIGDALAYLHGNDIVHRDVKPENFRLVEGRYKLLDFDTAFSRSQRGLMPQDGMPVGTPEYMSPEQARGATDIDARADIYSFGILLYELLTANVPFTGAPSRVLIDQMETPPRPPRAISSQVPPPVSDIIVMAIHKDRERRFQSIQAMMAALVNAYQSLHPAPRPETSAYPDAEARADLEPRPDAGSRGDNPPRLDSGHRPAQEGAAGGAA